MKIEETIAIAGLIGAAALGSELRRRPGGAPKKPKNSSAKRRNKKNKTAKASRKRNR